MTASDHTPAIPQDDPHPGLFDLIVTPGPSQRIEHLDESFNKSDTLESIHDTTRVLYRIN